MKIAPKKNIFPTLADIKHPLKASAPPLKPNQQNFQSNFFFENTIGKKCRKISVRRPNRISFPKIILTGLGIVILVSTLAGSLIFLKFGNPKTLILAKAGLIADNFQQALTALNNLEPQKAIIFFEKNNSELTAIQNNFQRFHLTKIINWGGFFGRILILNQSALAVSRNLETLQTNGLSLFLNGGGQKLTEIIKNLQKEIGKIGQAANSIRNQIASMSDKMAFLKVNFFNLNQINRDLTNGYLDYNAKFYQLEDGLAGLLDILQSKNDIHWLVFFQNPAEIRPAGGFLGSYADLTISSGKLANMDVRDIYDPDGQLEKKVVPPLPLQVITTGWGARDANWFFDFPLSAKKVTEFLEASKIYQEKNIRFSGVVALNIKVLESVLGLSGPIKLSDYQFEINQNNFLKEIQKEVEAGADKTRGEPKRVLKVLTPVLLEKINNFNEGQKKELTEKLKFHLSQKDVMFFAKEPRLQNFFSQNGFDGGVYKLPDNFWGSYLAVVNANIAGGKSDFFVNQEINLDINLDDNGKASNQLKIKRTHSGSAEKDYWWRAANQNFLKIFTSPESRLVNLSGNSQKTVKPPVDYQKNNYQEDPDLLAIEKEQQFSEDFNIWAGKESGKTVWATWFNLPAGKTKTLEAKYETPATAYRLLKTGQIYQFVFDKQSGVDGKLKVAIEAPSGYKWQESQSYIYEYQNDNPPARLIINLALLKI